MMRYLLFLVGAWFLQANCLFAQDATEIYKKGVEKVQAGEFEEAIELFGKTIELQPENYYAWFNRAWAKAHNDDEKGAIPDYNKAIELKPDYAKAYLNRALAKKSLTNYEDALKDIDASITLDPTFAIAYYERGLIHELHMRFDAACKDFVRANELGSKYAADKIKICDNKDRDTSKMYPILRLTKFAEDKTYGFSQTNPVKVGNGPSGSASNQRAYLNLLRDAKGKSLTYERLHSCCPYETRNAWVGGMALLDVYKIEFLNEKGEKETGEVYISFYDYEEPKILMGFKTAGQ